MPYKIGLALGGGGARGFAHLGVLRVMEQNQLPVSHITGCSMGAVIGGLYAYFQSTQRVEKFIDDLMQKPVFKELDFKIFTTHDQNGLRFSFTRFKKFYSLLKTLKTVSIFPEEIIEHIFAEFPQVNIEDLPISFATIATDLISGREIVINKGSLKKAIMASSAIPGVFPPVKIGDLLLIDGAASDNIPVSVVRGQGAQYVVAVDVSHCMGDVPKLDTGLQIVQRADEIVSFHLTQERLSGADLIIRPEVRHYSWAAIDKKEELIKAGEKATQKVLNDLQRFAQQRFVEI